MTSSPGFKSAVHEALALLGLALICGLLVSWAVYSGLDHSYGFEIISVLTIGILGGALLRGFAQGNRLTIVFYSLVAAEAVLLYQCPQPWFGLWPVLIPGNAMGFMVGRAARLVVLASKPKPRDVWAVNGIEDPRSDSAKAKAMDALSSWDAGESGTFRVQRDDAEFTAVGNPETGFIVHCTPDRQDEGKWRMLGADDADVVEIRLLSGPAYAPRGVLTDLAATSKALLGFFHHRGPDPELSWSEGEDVRTYRFGQMSR
ncbi:hypothetical protein N2K95_01970 [Arthrobacter zhaoxinii]|uniref:Uncharacterized protein n=1 Tax=Arthrobacter zhaoxinii TaxID=2964616 RepID=A0ABY5YV14_9MICC|nr:hypothetical protein [Arthrobacter zhaoxinii]UWX97485.1 hypothetical protein N2K95_01970 [Arthrobacter zhaoxinii]